jgi:phytanoyl-CoA hydroxylase
MSASDNASLKTSFDKDGYAFIPGFLNKTEIETLIEKLDDLIQNHLPKMPSNHISYEDKSKPETLKQLQDLQHYNVFFEEMLNDSNFEDIAEILLGERTTGKTVEYFNKPKKIGGPTPPHQDNYYFKLKPPKALTMWLALEKIDEKNGCLRYLKGSHLQGMRPHGKSKTIGFSQGITNYREEDFRKEIPVPALPGDLLIHHAMTIHRADKNSSNSRSRQSLGFIYFASTAQEDVEAKRKYQEELESYINQSIRTYIN